MDWAAIYAARYLGLSLIVVGCFFEIVAALGVLKAKDFFVRIHIATVSLVGGTVVPLVGVALVSLTLEELGPGGIHLTALCIATSILLLITAPTGSHVLARAAYTSRTKRRFDEELGGVEKR